MLLHVVFSHDPNCFVSLPPYVVKSIVENGAPFVALEVTWHTHVQGQSSRRRAFVAWSGGASAQRDTLEISAHFAASLDLIEGQEVDVQPRINISAADRIHVEPVSADDWEILELNQQYIEEQFINQVNLLFEHEVIPLWIHQQTVVNLRVVEIHPSPHSKTPCVRISHSTEVVVAPKPRDSLTPSSKAHKASVSRLLRVTDSTSDPTNVVVHPLDMDSFGWSNGGIVQLDGDKLNTPKQLNQMLSVYMNVQAVPNNNENQANNEANEGQQYH